MKCPKHLVQIIFIAILASLSCGASSVWAHPFHVSFAEAEWNTKTKVLEVALKVNPNDLEDALRRQTKRRIRLEADAAEKVIAEYLRQKFVVRSEKKKIVPFKWIGCEISVKDAWLYFEYSLPNGPNKITITNSILSHVRDQKNTVSLRNKKQRATLVFTQHKTELPVEFVSPKETSNSDNAQ